MIKFIISGILALGPQPDGLGHQNKHPAPPIEYQEMEKLATDKERIRLAWNAAKDSRLSDIEKFRYFLELTLDMNQRGTFIWEQMRSDPNWDETMALLVRGNGMAAIEYPFLRPWYANQCHDRLLDLLKSLGYYKADGMTACRR